MNLDRIVSQALTAIPNNVYEGHHNITLTFKVAIASGGVDPYGNAIATTQDVVVVGRAVRSSNRNETTETPGGDTSYLLLKINVVSVDGIVGASLPDAVNSSSVAIASYVGGDGRTYEGQFYVLPNASFTVHGIYQKIGPVLFGKFEVNGG